MDKQNMSTSNAASTLLRVASQHVSQSVLGLLRYVT